MEGTIRNTRHIPTEKLFTVIYLLAFLVFYIPGKSRAQQAKNIIGGRISDFETLRNGFKQPAKEYGTIPFFVWNGEITKAAIDEKMQDFKNAGCGGVIVHPRPGMITEYLSPEWFGLFQHTVEKGKELDLDVWIYDENSYPSGFGGGHVPAEMPESYNQGQGLQPTEADTIPSDYTKYFLILKNVDGKYTDVSKTITDELNKKGNYILFSKTYNKKSDWFGGFSYVDLLYPGVTEKFLEVTMPGYKKQSGNEFGKIIPGVFTDEPEIRSSGGLRWTPDLFDVFKKQWGYDLKVNIPSLYKKVGNWKKVRHNYTKTLLWLFTDRWSKPASEYYKKLGLKFTGHYWEHGWPSMRLGGDNMAMYAYHSVPGIDMLFNRFNEESPNAQFGNIRSVKELASVANQFNRSRTLCETYGGSGWEITFQDLKRLGDWEYALGVNLMNQHLSFFTIAGARKYDYPPSFSYHNPWWKSYSYLNNYYARLSLALSSGEQKNDILIIEPTTTAWLYDSYINEGRDSMIDRVGNTFQQFVTTLEKNQVEYDLGSEDIIQNHGKSGKNGFEVGNRIYSTVVIPPLMENLNKKTFSLIKKFVRNGGHLIIFSRPGLVDGNSSAEASGFFKQKASNIIYRPGLDESSLGLLLKKQGLKFIDVKGGNLYHHLRRLKDGQAVFLANSDMNEKTTGRLAISGKDAILLNVFTGGIVDYPEEVDGENINLNFSLEPAGSMLLYIADKRQEGYPPYEKKENLSLVPSVSDIVIEKEEDNVLPIDFCDLKTNGKELNDVHVYDATQEVFTEHGFPNGNPWNHSIQYKTNIIDRANFPENSGFEATYYFNIDGEFNYSDFKLVVERPGQLSVSINGHQLKPLPGNWWLDHSFGVFSIGEWVQAGENNIVISCVPMHIRAEIEPVYILGDFSLAPATKGWVIQAPKKEISTGSWKGQGLPFYSWDMVYRRNFEIQNKGAYYEVGLGDWKGTVAEVFANGEHAGTIALHTDRINVTDFIKEGDNQIEVRITGSLKNLLGPHHNNPKPGLSSPWNWRNVKKYPPGKEYQLLDYGLMGDIYLYK
ncbi:MAG: hypothetical protein GXO81_00800 [Chlorobi bacterium]|nr:hypothetical protein [Chlorobiota bacterium]